MLDGRKLCGILAEVVPADPDAVVIGAGVNTRMPTADLPVATAVSFAAIGQEADDDRLLADFLTGLDAQLGALAEMRGDARAAGVHDAVEELCSTIGADVAVALPDGGRLEGRARALDGDGRLIVATDDAEIAVSAGDVVHVR
jgi:BirA family biotin operon repressor/biotin-[acetyl-CoA-carboxylase] ligase